MPSLRARLVRWTLGHHLVRVTDDSAPVAEARAAMERSARLALLPRGTRVQRVTAGQRPAEWVVPAWALSDRVLLYLHGGSYSAGSPSTHRALVARLAAVARARGLTLNYRLAPEHLFPAPVEDAVGAYRWLRAQGFAPERIAVAGDSAGGGLALALPLALRDAGEPPPAVVGALSPWTDLTGSGQSVISRARVDVMLDADTIVPTARRYLGEADPRNPLASPLFGDLRGFPPTIIQVGDEEILLDDATRFAKRAAEAGATVELRIYPEMWHVWQAFAPYVPEATTAIREMGAFLDRYLSRS
jgi:epsilon-lactone hydrolase